MLKTSYIIANKEEVIKSLKKRNFDSEDLIAKLISLDERRKLIDQGDKYAKLFLTYIKE